VRHTFFGFLIADYPLVYIPSISDIVNIFNTKAQYIWDTLGIVKIYNTIGQQIMDIFFLLHSMVRGGTIYLNNIINDLFFSIYLNSINIVLFFSIYLNNINIVLFFSLYLLISLYYSWNLKKLHFVNFLTFIGFISISLIFIFSYIVISNVILSTEFIDNIPQDIYYNFLLFIFISYVLYIPKNTNFIVSLIIRILILIIIKLILISLFPNLDSYININILFLLLPELDCIVEEFSINLGIFIKNQTEAFIVYMNSGSSSRDYTNLGSNNPTGGNNGGDSNNPIVVNDNSDEHDVYSLRDPERYKRNTPQSIFGMWPIYFKLDNSLVVGLDSSFDRNITMTEDTASNILRAFASYNTFNDNCVFAVQFGKHVGLSNVRNLRALPVYSLTSITIWEMNTAPTHTSMDELPITARLINGEDRTFYLKVCAVLNIKPRYYTHIHLYADVPGESIQPYCFSNAKHWDKMLVVKNGPCFVKIIGRSATLFDEKKDFVITSNIKLRKSDLFSSDDLDTFSQAFMREKLKGIESKVTVYDKKIPGEFKEPIKYK